MLKSTKNNLIINNAIELGENISLEDKGKGRHFTSRFIEAGLAHYQEFGDVLITKETLDKFVYTMVGCPVIIRHKDITAKNVDKERVGVVSKVWYNELDGWFWCEGIIWDKQAIDLIKNQGWSVSCTYDFESDFKKGTYHGKDYDMEFTGGEFLHLALVDNPRYERANIVVNSKDEGTDNGFVTLKRKDGSTYQVKLNPLNYTPDSFSKYGADLEAYKISLKLDKKHNNIDLIKEVERIQEEIKDEIKYEHEQNIRMESRASGIKALLTQLSSKYNARVQTLDNSGYKFMIEGENIEGFSENTANNIVQRLNEYKELNIDATSKYTGKSTGWVIEAKIRKENKMIDNAKDKNNNDGEWITVKGNHIFIKDGQSKDEAVKEFIEKQQDKSSDKKESDSNISEEHINKINEMLGGLTNPDSAYERIRSSVKPYIEKNNLSIEDIIPHINKESRKSLGKAFRTKMYTDEDLYEEFVEVHKMKDYKSQTGKETKEIDEKHISWINETLSSPSITNPDNAYGTIERVLKPYIQKHNLKIDDIIPIINKDTRKKLGRAFRTKMFTDEDLKTEFKEIHKINNEGDTTMTVLNELKRFIQNVVNNKGDDMEAKNEKVDKRDIIRQIMAIAGKEEASEDVKTIAKLAEKLAYDKSEAETADNKCKNEDEEKEEKFEEEKEIANKAKNKEDEEDKEEEKKADNKCKNSLDETRKIVFGGKQVENENKYVPISKRIEMGNQY